jgi:hypothetical protein
VPELMQTATSGAAEWLLDRRNARALPHRLKRCKYGIVRNSHAEEGRSVVKGRTCRSTVGTTYRHGSERWLQQTRSQQPANEGGSCRKSLFPITTSVISVILTISIRNKFLIHFDKMRCPRAKKNILGEHGFHGSTAAGVPHFEAITLSRMGDL